MKNWLIEKDPDTGKDWRQEEKGTTKDEVVGWHHHRNGHEFEQAWGDGEGQRSLSGCSPWGRRESAWLSDWTTLISICFPSPLAPSLLSRHGRNPTLALWPPPLHLYQLASACRDVYLSAHSPQRVTSETVGGTLSWLAQRPAFVFACLWQPCFCLILCSLVILGGWLSRQVLPTSGLWTTVCVAKSCLTFCGPMDCSPPGSSVHGISQASILEWGAISFSRGSSRPRNWTWVSCTGRLILHHWATDTSCQVSGSVGLEIKCVINVMCVNHPETIPWPWSVEILSSTKPVPGTK